MKEDILKIPAEMIDELSQYYEVRDEKELFLMGVNFLKTCHNFIKDGGYTLAFLKLEPSDDNGEFCVDETKERAIILWKDFASALEVMKKSAMGPKKD